MRLTPVTLAVALACWLAGSCAAAESQAKLKVLIVTGDDVEPAHNWSEVASATKQILQSAGKFDVKVCEDAGIFDSASSLNRYDLVYFAMYNAKTPTISDQAKENLLNYVKSGKGFVVAHLASASFKEWQEFRNLCGRVWIMGTSGHGPRSVFKARIKNNSHPITKGMSDFEVDDELYAKLQGDAPINVLIEADSDWSKKTEPLAFTLEYGKGRVFHHTFGHDAKAMATPSVQLLVRRGCEWAATGTVKD